MDRSTGGGKGMAGMEFTYKLFLGTLLIMTLIAGCAPQSTPIQPSAAPPPATETATASAMPTAQPSSTPALMTGGEIPCYAGPGEEYGAAATLGIGVPAEVLGKDGGDGFWIIRMPGITDQCWIDVRYATILGTPESIPTLIVESLATAEILRIPGPSQLIAKATCVHDVIKQRLNQPGGTSIMVRLTWRDVRGEMGYRLYLDGKLLAEVGADVDRYDHWFTPRRNMLAQNSYTIEAYDTQSASTQARVDVTVRAVCAGF